jgi:hypothetical protein
VNWGTLTSELMADGQKPDTTKEAPRVQRAICDSIALHSRERLFFMEKRGSLTLLTGVDSYGLGTGANKLPVDLLSISGQTIDLDLQGDAAQRWQLRWRPAETIDDMRRRQAITGQPDYFGWYANNIELWPKPSRDGDVLRFRYLSAPGVPIKRFETSTWKFYKPYTTSFVVGNLMADAYPDPALSETNLWFDTVVGYNVIRHHALFLLWSGPWRGSADQAQQQQVMYLEALTALKEWSYRKSVPRQVQPYTGGEDSYYDG